MGYTRRGYEQCLAAVVDEGAETYVAGDDAGVAGFVIIVMKGSFVGYIRSLAVREDWRSRGLGSRLMAFAEGRIYRETPNVCICVSSFNERACALYLRLGYKPVGQLEDYVVRGHSEWLLRKSRGPLSEFRPEPTAT